MGAHPHFGESGRAEPFVKRRRAADNPPARPTEVRFLENPLQYLIDRTQIVEVVIRYFNALDDRDFVALRSTISDTIAVDFSPLSGAEGETHDADVFVASVTKSLSEAPATQHISANHVVAIAGDRADATASLYAWHKPTDDGEGIGTLRGAYAVELTRTALGWRIDGLRMRALWAKPDRQVHLAK